MARRGDQELDVHVAFLIRQGLDFLGFAQFGADNVMAVFDAVASFEHVEAGIAPVHDDNEWTGIVQAFQHLDGSGPLVRFRDGLEHAVLVCTVHEVEHHVGVDHGEGLRRFSVIPGPALLLDGIDAVLGVRDVELAAVDGVNPVGFRQVERPRVFHGLVVGMEQVFKRLGRQLALSLLVGRCCHALVDIRKSVIQFRIEAVSLHVQGRLDKGLGVELTFPGEIVRRFGIVMDVLDSVGNYVVKLL